MGRFRWVWLAAAVIVLALVITFAIVILGPEQPPSSETDRTAAVSPEHDGGSAEDPPEAGSVTLVGRVLSFSGEPVAGRVVRAEQDGRTRTVSPTDARGRWGVTGLRPASTVLLAVERAGMVSLPVVGLQEGEARRVDIRLPGGLPLEVSVVDEVSQPVSGAEVAVHVRSLWRPVDLPAAWPGGTGVAVRSVDASGKARFPDLPGGAYLLVARHVKYAAASRRIWRGPGEAEAKGVVLVLRPAHVVEGRVLDPDGRPVPGVRVLGGAPSPVGVRAVTDAEGSYRLEGLTEGEQTIGAARPGASIRSIVTVHVPRVRYLDLVLRPVATLRGRVTDVRSGEPIAGARVVAGTGNGWDEQRQSARAITDASGAYEIATLRPGRLMFVHAEKDGWARTGAPVSDVSLVEGVVTVADVGMRPTARIEGVVTGPDGPVSGAEVSALGESAARDVTDLGGRYRLEHLDAGTYRVVVDAEGHVHPPGGYGEVHLEASGRVTHDVELIRGEGEEWAETEAEGGSPRTIVIRGRVRAADGGSCAGCSVEVRDKSTFGILVDQPVSWNLWDGEAVREDGSFEIACEDPARTIEFSAAGKGFATSKPREIEVSPDRDEVEVEIVMGRGHTLRARVVSAGTGDPVVGATASLVVPADGGASIDWMDGPPPPVVHATTAADGTLSIEHVPPGSYVLRIGAAGYVDASAEVTLPRDGPLVIDLSASRKLAGVVRYADGTTPGVVTLAVRPEAGEETIGGTHSDRHGRFVVRGLPPGRYVIEVDQHFDNRVNVLQEEIGPFVAGPSEVVVTVRRGRTITGRVVGPEGEGVDHAFLEAEDAEGWPVGHLCWSEPDGSFEIPGLPRGAFLVSVEASGFEPASLEGIVAGARDVRVVLSRGKSVSGTILREDGGPLAGRSVYAVSPGRGGYHSNDDPRTETDAEGRFTLSGLAPKVYEVALGADFRDPLVLLDAGPVPAGTTGLRLTAGRGATLTGRVVDENGRPVPGAVVEADPSTYGMVRKDETDDDGRFAITGLFPKVSYELEVELEGFVPATVKGLRAGGEPVEIRLVKGLEVTGRVLGPDGRPMRRASLVLRPDEGRRVEGTTDDEGGFRVRGLAPGSYSVHVMAEGPDGDILSFDGGDVEAGARVVVIRARAR